MLQCHSGLLCCCTMVGGRHCGTVSCTVWRGNHCTVRRYRLIQRWCSQATWQHHGHHKVRWCGVDHAAMWGSLHTWVPWWCDGHNVARQWGNVVAIRWLSTVVAWHYSGQVPAVVTREWADVMRGAQWACTYARRVWQIAAPSYLVGRTALCTCTLWWQGWVTRANQAGTVRRGRHGDGHCGHVEWGCWGAQGPGGGTLKRPSNTVENKNETGKKKVIYVIGGWHQNIWWGSQHMAPIVVAWLLSFVLFCRWEENMAMGGDTESWTFKTQTDSNGGTIFT